MLTDFNLAETKNKLKNQLLRLELQTTENYKN